MLRTVADASSTPATGSTRSRRCKQIPFEQNTNDFHFDTEIIIQFVLAGLRIVELPDPDLLRRRDLPRERPEIRLGRRRSRC